LRSAELSRLVLDNTVLINAIELVDWDEEPTQFLICEACGYVHCKRGDWVSSRSSPGLIGVARPRSVCDSSMQMNLPSRFTSMAQSS
jgi:hypothetical protein